MWPFFMDKNISGFRSTLDKLNREISSINEGMSRYVKNTSQMAKMLVDVEKSKKSIDKRVTKVVDDSSKLEGKKEKKQQVAPANESSGIPLGPSQAGIDYRSNPLFLKAAEYFGVTEKDYALAVNKIAAIVDWAVGETKSTKPGEIIAKIAETSRSLPFPAWGERRYAILYRYVKLADQQKTLRESIERQPNPQAEEAQQDVEKEMTAYAQ